MDTKYMQSFVAVVEAGSFAEAARRLDLTSAAIAARIKALEEDLGVALVKRSGRSVKPTESGIRILEETRAVIRNIRDLRAMAVDGGQAGELRMGCFVSALINVLPPILKRLYGIYPNASIFITPGASIDLCAKVANGELDAAIVVEPQFAVPKNCVWQSFMEEPLVVVAPVSLKGQDAHQLLETQPFLRYDRSVYGGQLADRYLRDHQIRTRQRLEIDSLLAIASLVHEGLGVSLIPDWSYMWESLDIVRVALPGRAPVRRNGLVWNAQGHHAKMAASVYDEAKALFGTRA
ncbi:LysR family transcriptional regulator [Pollutimonas subterranea]|uniref:LysR family transcriptional regulator n=1 Tax=Pollutimonas subterranea TaxID=2045210 RepID=A0A2N4U6M9_9BURK|nr:LysR family transcriptional regulator [Pollutimonas subterranea]PLC50678.1 LysR family transcriptional regulator [Pollutimonas subterranea]